MSDVVSETKCKHCGTVTGQVTREPHGLSSWTTYCPKCVVLPRMKRNEDGSVELSFGKAPR